MRKSAPLSGGANLQLKEFQLTLIHFITKWHSLFPKSHTRIPNSFPYGLPAQWAEMRAYRVPLN